MQKKERTNRVNIDIFRKSILSVIILLIALQLFKYVMDYSASVFPPAALFLAWGIYELMLAFDLWKPSRLEAVRHLINADIHIACCVMLFIGGNTEKLLNIAGILFGLTLALSRVFSIVRKRSARSISQNVISICLLALLFLVLRTGFGVVNIFSIILPMINIISVAFAQIKISVLKRIIRKTFAVEILFGMLLLILAISIILPGFEPGVENFSDALWYCFAIVTTIGFGDFTAITGIGRLLSVILGIYGIIVVSLVTSIIVNFYSEVKTDEGAKEEFSEAEAGDEKDETGGK